MMMDFFYLGCWVRRVGSVVGVPWVKAEKG